MPKYLGTRYNVLVQERGCFSLQWLTESELVLTHSAYIQKVAVGDGMRAHFLLKVSLFTSQTISKCGTLNYVLHVPHFGPSDQKVGH